MFGLRLHTCLNVVVALHLCYGWPVMGSGDSQPYAIVEPVEEHTKLKLSQEGLDVLRSIKGPVAPVAVIGPYRSGKSFTLNQLMKVPCDEGFGVGHSRKTQTKGIWFWGKPMEVQGDNGEKVNLIFIDSEGFESTGKADVYDDRIFALSTLISQVLIYNLPETIRESDLEKLSFAAELAKAFYSTSGPESKGSKTIQPGSMIWLIQRDFLEGDSLQRTLENALRQVPNPHKDPAISQLNHIRQGLETITQSSTAIGLPQPHLDRTKLCELDESLFDSMYLKQREVLRDLVNELARPKTVAGHVLSGSDLADLIVKTVTALNEREIPTAGSLVQYFNRDLVSKCKDRYVKKLAKHNLPMEDEDLRRIGGEEADIILEEFEHERFGSDVEDLKHSLEGMLQTELEARQSANELASSKLCEHAEMECEDILEKEANQKLPSVGRFTRKYEACKDKFETVCIGPGKEHNAERLQHAWQREHVRFEKEFNDKLLNGIIVLSIILIVLFRFLFRWALGETLGWLIFIFLQIYPRTFIGSSSSMFETKGWKMMTKAWELMINNPFVDLETWGFPLLGMFVILYLLRRRTWRMLSRLLPAKLRRKRSKFHGAKDLDV